MKYRKFQITPKWYIDKKPYKQADNYDKYWINLTKNVDKIFHNYKDELFDDDISNEDIAEIAYVMTSYFEDFISDIGIWKALRNKHLEFYNTPVPFLVKNKESYDYDYINKPDIKFLFWRMLNIYFGFGEFYDLDDNILDTITEKLYDLFDSEYETAYETDFYNNFLKIESNDDYFKIRDKIFWFSHSYLFDEITEKYISSQIEDIEINDEFDLQKIHIMSIYATEESIYKIPTEFSALTVYDVFMQVVRADENCKENLKRIKVKHYGYFNYLSEDDKYLIFENIATKKEYKVLKKSMNEKMKAPKPGTMILCGFIFWNNEWWLSGIFASYPDNNLEDDMKKSFQEYLYQYDKKYQEDMDTMLNNQKQDFYNFFNNKKIIIYDSGKELEKDYNSFFEFQRKQRTKKSKEARKHAKKHKFKKVQLPDEILKSNDICLYFNPLVGTAMIHDVKYFIDIISRNEDIDINYEEHNFIFDYFTSDSIHYKFFEYLSKEYDLSNLGVFFNIPDFNVEQDLEALGRLYKSSDFRENPVPFITLTDDGKVLPLDDDK